MFTGNIVGTSQTLLDLRVSKIFRIGEEGKLLVDILNTLDDSAEAFIVTNNFYSPNFGKAVIVIAPRRARDAWHQVFVLNA